MKLVIDIDEEIYKDIMIHNREMREGGKSAYYFEELIQNGTPLPKGHGRLIDADYKVSSDGRTIDTVCGYMAPTIIEADKEE